MTRYGPFAESSPRGLTGWISDRLRPIPDHLRMMLRHLDGDGLYTYSIWRGSDPESISGFDTGDSFMQAAGSADGMTVEARILAPDGQYRLFVIGRAEPSDGSITLMPISDTRAVQVSSNEVFSAEEAALIFYTYYLTESVSQPYVLRELDLSQELSVLR